MSQPLVRFRFSSGPLRRVGFELILVGFGLVFISAINQEAARACLIIWLAIDWLRGLLRFVFRQKREKRITRDEDYWVCWYYAPDEWIEISGLLVRRYRQWMISLVLPLAVFSLAITYFAWKENPTWLEIGFLLGVTLTIVIQLIITRLPMRFSALGYSNGQVRIGEVGIWVAGPVGKRQIEYFVALPGRLKSIALRTSEPAILQVESEQRFAILVRRYYVEAVVPAAQTNGAIRLMEKLKTNHVGAV